MYVRDLNGNEYPLEATVTHDFELNGKPVLSFVAKSSRVNDVFLEEFDAMWQVIDFDDVVHRIEYARKRGEGERLQVDVKATPSFYDDFAVSRIYTRYDEHMTAAEAFTLIFTDTDYSFVLVDAFAAVQWAGFGDGDTRLETFKRALERYNAEFRISGNTIYLEQQIGEDTSFMYRYRLNASNIQQEVDASNYWTYMRGYGDFAEGEEENALLFREYSSPLAAIIGKRDAPPYYNGSISTVERMDEVLRETVDNSLKVSVSTDVIDLRKQGYPLAQPNLGDRVYLTDERIGFDEEVRIYQMTIVRDWKGDVLDLKLVIGSPGLVKRHQAQLSNAVDRITDLVDGKLPIPLSTLPDTVKAYTAALKSVLTELVFDNGIIAVDKDDPNKLVLLNSAGLGISNDGGNTFKTAITGDGIVADYILAGMLQGMTFLSDDGTSTMWVQGGDIRLTDTGNGRNLNLNPLGMTGFDELGNILFQATKTWVTSSILGTNTTNVYTAAETNGELRVVDINGIPGDGLIDSYNYLPIRASGIFGNFWNINPASGVNAQNLYARPLSDGEVRVTANSTTDLYRDLRARTGFMNTVENNALFGESIHLYVKPRVGGELRVTEVGSVTNYVPVRASGFFGSHIDTPDTHLYLRPAGDPGEARVTVRGTTDVYQPIRAKDFITDTSVRDNKTNIEVYDADTLSTVRNSSAYMYNRATDKEGARKQLGLMIDELPQETHSDYGDSFALYALAGFNFKVAKDILAEHDKLRAEYDAYKQETNDTIAALVKRVEALEAR